MRRLVGSASVLLVLVLAAGCGGDDERRYRGSVTVLEDDDHGPQLCYMTMTSDPPQCSGPDVVGWDWDDVSDEESGLDTIWGRYEVTGTWDGERQRLTLTEPSRPATSEGEDDQAGEADKADDEPDFSTPCPEPEGGWRVVDPDTTTQESMEAAHTVARRRSDFAGLWLDQSVDPGPDLNRPKELILNVRVTGDVEDAEDEIRKVWGGMLCVSSAGRTKAELAQIRDEITDAIPGASGGVDDTRERVTVTVWVDDGLQFVCDKRFGEGVVDVTAILHPVD